jgi:hypothetical protein
MKKKVIKKYWYFTEITECVLCGCGDSVKFRKPGKKPKNPNKRYSYKQTACSEHFI